MATSVVEWSRSVSVLIVYPTNCVVQAEHCSIRNISGRNHIITGNTNKHTFLQVLTVTHSEIHTPKIQYNLQARVDPRQRSLMRDTTLAHKKKQFVKLTRN
jgi:hypothetical protein